MRRTSHPAGMSVARAVALATALLAATAGAEAAILDDVRLAKQLGASQNPDVYPYDPVVFTITLSNLTASQIDNLSIMDTVPACLAPFANCNSLTCSVAVLLTSLRGTLAGLCCIETNNCQRP